MSSLCLIRALWALRLPLLPGMQDEESTLRVCDPLSFPKSKALLRAKSSVFPAEVPGGGDRLSQV